MAKIHKQLDYRPKSNLNTMDNTNSNPYCKQTKLPVSQPHRQLNMKTLTMTWLIVMVIAALTAGEEIFHSRYHDDQSVLNPPLYKTSIRTEEQALVYLEKYGYLNCGPEKQQEATPSAEQPLSLMGFMEGQQARRHRRQVGPLSEVLLREGAPVVHQPCPLNKVAEAVSKFQKSYHIEPSGFIDAQTIQAMNKNRCGNSDEDLEASTNKFIKAAMAVRPPTKNTRRRRRALDLIEKSQAIKIREARSIDHLQRDSLLSQVLLGDEHFHKSQSINRRKQMMREYKERIEAIPPSKLNRDDKETANVIIDGSFDESTLEHLRPKRSAAIEESYDNFSNGAKAFSKQTVHWRLLQTSLSRHIPYSDQRATLQLAFRMWSEVIPIKFIEDTDGSVAAVDIRIAFAKERHLNCDKPFDGSGGAIAHSQTGGDIHFDDAEPYKAGPIETLSAVKDFDEVMLLKVAVHEIGHVLGLNHTSREYSVMFALYNTPSAPEEGQFELGWEDRKYVQNIYGCCKGSFDTVFDWVRPMASGSLVYNSYFFRNGIYWLYENRYNRTRYGDPLLITIGWKGVPAQLDSYAQVFYSFTPRNQTTTTYILEAFFFKGEQYYKYDHEKDEVAATYPHPIAKDFGPMPSNATGFAGTVPGNLDSVFYNRFNTKLYFFKAEKVYVVDYMKYLERHSDAGCCDVIATFADMFPAAPGEQNILTGYITSVYYSYRDNTLFFLKDEEVWQDINFPNAPPRLKYMSKWYEKWFDICEAY